VHGARGCELASLSGIFMFALDQPESIRAEVDRGAAGHAATAVFLKPVARPHLSRQAVGGIPYLSHGVNVLHERGHVR